MSVNTRVVEEKAKAIVELVVNDEVFGAISCVEDFSGLHTELVEHILWLAMGFSSETHRKEVVKFLCTLSQQSIISHDSMERGLELIARRLNTLNTEVTDQRFHYGALLAEFVSALIGDKVLKGSEDFEKCWISLIQDTVLAHQVVRRVQSLVFPPCPTCHGPMTTIREATFDLRKATRWKAWLEQGLVTIVPKTQAKCKENCKRKWLCPFPGCKHWAVTSSTGRTNLTDHVRMDHLCSRQSAAPQPLATEPPGPPMVGRPQAFLRRFQAALEGSALSRELHQACDKISEAFRDLEDNWVTAGKLVDVLALAAARPRRCLCTYAHENNALAQGDAELMSDDYLGSVAGCTVGFHGAEAATSVLGYFLLDCYTTINSLIFPKERGGALIIDRDGNGNFYVRLLNEGVMYDIASGGPAAALGSMHHADPSFAPNPETLAALVLDEYDEKHPLFALAGLVLPQAVPVHALPHPKAAPPPRSLGQSGAHPP